jgi:hypothetical protein
MAAWRPWHPALDTYRLMPRWGAALPGAVPLGSRQMIAGMTFCLFPPSFLTESLTTQMSLFPMPLDKG